jgi:3-deoxy-D-manno-octulosonate 8-phosphate phosphatase (KDO 8-P phosphatase)
LSFPDSILSAARDIRLFVTDVDGVWTDGHITVHADGTESVRFCVHDGYGMVQLIRSGVEVVVLSGRDNPAVRHRAERLGVSEIHMGSIDKAPVMDKILSSRGLSENQVATMGDDLPDIAMFERAGLCFAPANAVLEIQNAADWVTPSPGGSGALREVCNLLLAAQSATTS